MARAEHRALPQIAVGHISWAEPEVIAHSRGHIETCPVIQVRFRSLILENILEMVGAEGSAIFPLSVANTIALRIASQWSLHTERPGSA